MQRLATEEGARHRSCESRKSTKTNIARCARAPLAPANPYTINILRRAPAWCIFFRQKVIVTLWPAGSADDRLESFLPINASMLLCGFSRRNRTIHATIVALVIPLKRIRSTSQALRSNCEEDRRRIRSLVFGFLTSQEKVRPWKIRIIIFPHCIRIRIHQDLASEIWEVN